MTRVSGSGSWWLRRRLGAAGSARLRVRDRVAAPLHAAGDVLQGRIGLDDDELSRFAEAFHLSSVANAVVGRGDADRLRTIAWWGSALADLVLDSDSPARDAILTEAAAFNLGVALFDSVVDDSAIPAGALVEALEPKRMAARLSSPYDQAFELSCRDSALDLVVLLFDAMLASAGRRVFTDVNRRDLLADQLESMYQSELGLAPDPFIAKTGPVRFIGALATSSDSAVRLYSALARFCQEWDDWQDMADDLSRFAPNVFLGAPRLGAGAVAFAIKGTWRVGAGPLLHAGIANRLSDRMQDIIDAARGCGTTTYCKTLRLCRELVG